MSKIIVFAFPVFLLCIALEFWWDQRQARLNGAPSRFGLSDSLNSVVLGLMSQLTGVLSKFIGLLLYAAVFDSVSIATTFKDELAKARTGRGIRGWGWGKLFDCTDGGLLWHRLRCHHPQG